MAGQNAPGPENQECAMATVSTTVSGLAGIADDATDAGILNITSGTLTATSLATVTGYSTINVTANAAHVISMPATILVDTAGTVPMLVGRTIGFSLTGASLTGNQLKVNLTASEGHDTAIRTRSEKPPSELKS